MFDLDENEKPQTYQQILEKLFLNKDDANRFRVSEYFNHTINLCRPTQICLHCTVFCMT